MITSRAALAAALLAVAGLAIQGVGRLAGLALILLEAGLGPASLAVSGASLLASLLLALAGGAAVAGFKGYWRLAGAFLLAGSLLSALVSLASLYNVLAGPFEAGGAPGFFSVVVVLARASSLLVLLGLAGLSLAVLGARGLGVVAVALLVSVPLAPLALSRLLSGPDFMVAHLAATAVLSIAVALLLVIGLVVGVHRS